MSCRVIFFLASVFVSVGHAETLPELIELARKNNPQAQVQKHSEQVSESQLSRISGEFGPRLKARIGVGPITESQGDALSSVQDTSNIGAAYLGSLEFTWPIYTWGRQSALRTAAENGVLVTQAEGQEKFQQLDYDVKEAYFGVLFAKTMIDFISGHREKLVEILEKMKDKKKSKTEIYRLEVLLATVDSKMADAEAALDIAQMGLAVRTGKTVNDKVELAEEWLSPDQRERSEFQVYADQFLARNYQLRKINAGIEAKQALAKSERLAKFPVPAVLAKYDYSSASVREDQQSAFAYDPFNQSQLIFGIGFQWDYQFGLHSAKETKYLAEKNVLVAQRKQAEDGLLALVKKAWIDLGAAEKKLQAAKKGNRSAKKLWSRSAMSMAAGLSTSEKISQAFTARAFAGKDYYEAVFAYELAWAELSKIVGVEIDPKFLKSKKIGAE
jgi:outer membrane protein